MTEGWTLTSVRIKWPLPFLDSFSTVYILVLCWTSYNFIFTRHYALQKPSFQNAVVHFVVLFTGRFTLCSESFSLCTVKNHLASGFFSCRNNRNTYYLYTAGTNHVKSLIYDTQVLARASPGQVVKSQH